jgi:hypothetical protein
VIGAFAMNALSNVVDFALDAEVLLDDRLDLWCLGSLA